MTLAELGKLLGEALVLRLWRDGGEWMAVLESSDAAHNRGLKWRAVGDTAERAVFRVFDRMVTFPVG